MSVLEIVFTFICELDKGKSTSVAHKTKVIREGELFEIELDVVIVELDISSATVTRVRQVTRARIR